MTEIQRTKEYDKFKFLLGNRDINPANVRMIKLAIQEDNQLHLYPIIVNNDFEVINGQHRLMAAKELEVYIYFIQDKHVTANHILSGHTQKPFVPKNYIDFFSLRENKKDYVQLNHMMKLSNLQPKAILNLVGIVNNNLINDLKKGNFEFPEGHDHQIFNLYCEFLSYVRERHIKPLGMISGHSFTRAFRLICMADGFEPHIFFQKLALRWFDLKPQGSSEDWYKLLASMYNWRNNQKIAKEFKG